MTPLEHWSVVEELVLNRAAPSEIRGHLLPIKEALEAYSQLQTDHTQLKDAHSKCDPKFKDLLMRHLELKGSQGNPKPDTRWPRSPLDHGRGASQVAGANRRWRCQFRYRGSHRKSAVAQLTLASTSAFIL